MSRKREREDDEYLKDSNKKAKISKDKKHKKDKKEKKKNKGKQADLKQEVGSQVFDITELVENILKYLIRRPETVLSIAKVSRRHNAIVHSKSFWTRLGFTEKLSDTDTIEPAVLVKLLLGIRHDYVEKKYAKQTAILNANRKRAKPIGNSLDLSFDDELLVRSHLEHFLAQRTYTSEAYIAIDRLRSNSKMDSYYRMDEFLEMLFMPESEIKRKEETSEYLANSFKRRNYPKSDDDFEGYHILMEVCGSEDDTFFEIRKKFIDENKFVVFIIYHGYMPAVRYISVNEKSNMIECCGDLILSALDPHNRKENRSVTMLTQDVLRTISVFLSTSIFKLKNIDEKLAKKELPCLSGGREIRVDRKVKQYYWKDIPLYKK